MKTKHARGLSAVLSGELETKASSRLATSFELLARLPHTVPHYLSRRPAPLRLSITISQLPAVVAVLLVVTQLEVCC